MANVRSSELKLKQIGDELSALAYSVVHRCSRLVSSSSKDLQHQFEEDVAESLKDPSKYSRNFLEYCCFRALVEATQASDYLNDKDFRRLTFDMMLAWEAPVRITQKPSSIKIDVACTVGKRAFVRFGPCISGVADVITAHNQYDALVTSSQGGRLSFPTYEKYLRELKKAIKAMKCLTSGSHRDSPHLSTEDKVIVIEGTIATQPILRHIGSSTSPGRLILTDRALYFEDISSAPNITIQKLDLCTDLHHVVKPYLHGPLDARLLNRSLLYKSSETPDPLVFEFPELQGKMQCNYWLALIKEILSLHKFIRRYRLVSNGRIEAISRSLLGIARLRATNETMRIQPPCMELLLNFTSANELPGGDIIFDMLADVLSSRESGTPKKACHETYRVYSRSALSTLTNLGLYNAKDMEKYGNATSTVSECLIGDLTCLEKQVLKLQDYKAKIVTYQSTKDAIKVDGLCANLTILKELLQPLIAVVSWIQDLQSWNEPFKTSTFLILCSYIILRDLIRYVIPVLLLCLVAFAIWTRQNGEGHAVGEIRTRQQSHNQGATGYLHKQQQTLSDIEQFIQGGNIALLKIRTLILSTVPEMTDQAAVFLVVLAFAMVIFPTKAIILIIVWDMFTRRMPLRQERTELFERRVRQWWYNIPLVPTQVREYQR